MPTRLREIGPGTAVRSKVWVELLDLVHVAVRWMVELTLVAREAAL